jgi:hypothetical protein
MVGIACVGKPALAKACLTSGFDRKGPLTLPYLFGLTLPFAAFMGKGEASAFLIVLLGTFCLEKAAFSGSVAARQIGACTDKKTTRANTIAADCILKRETIF